MTEENLGGEAGLIEERKKKLKLLRESNKAYVNDFDRTHRAEAIIADHQQFSKAELEEKNIMNLLAAFHHVKTSIKSSIKNFYSWWGLSSFSRKRLSESSFPT